MKLRRLAKVFAGIIVIGISMLLTGSAWAYVVEVPIGHNTISYLVDGKTDYNPTVAGAIPPKYGYTYVELYPTDSGPKEATGGSITLNTKTTTAIENWNGVPKGSFTGGKDYSLVWSADYAGYHLAADDDNSEIRFLAGAETGFSEMEIEVSLGSITETTKTPALHTTARQMDDKCVPYIELLTEGENVTGARWRFVDPSRPSVALTRQAGGGNIAYISYVNLYDSPYDVLAEGSIRKTWSVGETLSGVVTFNKAVPLERLGYVRLAFQYGDSWISNQQQLNPYTFYSWLFYPKNTSEPENPPNSDDSDDSDGGGGCNAGMLGIFGLLGAGFVFEKSSRRRNKF